MTCGVGRRFARSLRPVGECILHPGAIDRPRAVATGYPGCGSEPGATVDAGHGKTTTTIGLPGTGLSYRTTTTTSPTPSTSAARVERRTWPLFWALVALIATVYAVNL